MDQISAIITGELKRIGETKKVGGGQRNLELYFLIEAECIQVEVVDKAQVIESYIESTLKSKLITQWPFILYIL